MEKVRVVLDKDIEDIDRFSILVAFIDRMLDSVEIIQKQVTITELRYIQGRGYQKGELLKKIEKEAHQQEVGSPIIFITKRRVYNHLSDTRRHNIGLIAGC